MTDDRKEPYMEAERPFSVDDEGIPILNDVVNDLRTSPGEASIQTDQRPVGHSLDLPDRGELISAVRDRLGTELQTEMEGLIELAVAETVSEVMDDFATTARKKLSRLLKKRSDELLERIMDEEFSKSR
ncbi:MAG: hypothetical protein ABW162_07800 [Candidatus Sedimenticola sp. PURPLELP]